MLLSLFSNPAQFIFFIVAILIALSVHEFAHAYAAYLSGDLTAKMMGRLTLNPLKHIDPIGIIVFLLIGFGWGRPVPYNPNQLRNGRWGEFLVAFAGPLSNIITAFLFALPSRIYFMQTGQLPAEGVFVFLSFIVLINLVLATFNLLPIPPLDGYRILHLIIDGLSRGRIDLSWYERNGVIVLLFLIFLDRLMGLNILGRLMEPLLVLFNWFVGAVPL